MAQTETRISPASAPDFSTILTLLGVAIAHAPELDRVNLSNAIDSWVERYPYSAKRLLNARGNLGEIWQTIIETADAISGYMAIEEDGRR